MMFGRRRRPRAQVQAHPFRFACGCDWSGGVSADEGRIVCREHGAELEPFEHPPRVSQIIVRIEFVMETSDEEAAGELVDRMMGALAEDDSVTTITGVVEGWGA